MTGPIFAGPSRALDGEPAAARAWSHRTLRALRVRAWAGRVWWALCLVVALTALASGARADIRVVDDRGREVRLAEAPRRVVSLLPSLTETVCVLGGCDRLVGVDSFSNWPARVQSLPRLGGLEDASVERIVGLRPDVVLLARSARISERLESLGIAVVALEPTTHEDARSTLRRVATLLALPDATARADALWQRVQDETDVAARALSPAARGASYYFEVNSAPYAAGEASFIGQTLARLGLRNIVGPALGPFPQINPEWVVRADPRYILISDREEVALARRPGWAHLQAVRERRVCRFSPEEGDMLVRPGPRLADAARVLVRCLNALEAAR